MLQENISILRKKMPWMEEHAWGRPKKAEDKKIRFVDDEQDDEEEEEEEDEGEAKVSSVPILILSPLFVLTH